MRHKGFIIVGVSRSKVAMQRIGAEFVEVSGEWCVRFKKYRRSRVGGV